ncbi:hypothetical protein [Candidatus Halocynthiibacter alkanivorans]|uniref:hypothetical protein n=1 Tax=Candidatus Halocynthiibacter alkanivorans TaxID=2267619 RepID=UPI000DF45B4B|nr:hypothetical protein [Candidatus Halocynthiibacter alkanivorans]
MRFFLTAVFLAVISPEIGQARDLQISPQISNPAVSPGAGPLPNTSRGEGPLWLYLLAIAPLGLMAAVFKIQQMRLDKRNTAPRCLNDGQSLQLLKAESDRESCLDTSQLDQEAQDKRYFDVWRCP